MREAAGVCPFAPEVVTKSVLVAELPGAVRRFGLVCVNQISLQRNRIRVRRNANTYGATGAEAPSFSTFSKRRINSSGISHFDSFVSVYVV